MLVSLLNFRRVPSVLILVSCISCALAVSQNANMTTEAAVTTGPTGLMTTHDPAVTTDEPTTRGPTDVVTTRPGELTTGSPVTVPPLPTGVGNWTIKDSGGNVCMRMSFAAQLNITYIKTNKKEGTVVINVNPLSADLVSDCSPSSTRSLTIYPFSKLESDWTIQLKFKKQSSGYSMTYIGTSWVYDSRFKDSGQSGVMSSESRTQDNFLDQEVAMGNSYTCPEPLTITTGQATISLSHIQLQPFAEEADGKFGKAEPCATGLGVTIIIIIAVAAGVLFIAIVAVVVIVVRRKQKKKYDTFQDE